MTQQQGDTHEASTLISQRIAQLGGWRAEVLRRVRAPIRKADPEVVEEWKWKATTSTTEHSRR